MGLEVPTQERENQYEIKLYQCQNKILDQQFFSSVVSVDYQVGRTEGNSAERSTSSIARFSEFDSISEDQV